MTRKQARIEKQQIQVSSKHVVLTNLILGISRDTRAYGTLYWPNLHKISPRNIMFVFNFLST